MQTLKKRIIASHIKIKTKMKVKNLLLAGLAVAAMTACSNDEIIDNDGIQTNGENAAMQINFQFPTTRVVSDGGTNAGIDIEYAATEITAVLEYTETNKRIVVSIRLGYAICTHPYRRPPAPGRGATCSSTFTPSSSFLTTSLCCSISLAISTLGAFSIFTLRIIVFSRGKIFTHSF